MSLKYIEAIRNHRFDPDEVKASLEKDRQLMIDTLCPRNASEVIDPEIEAAAQVLAIIYPGETMTQYRAAAALAFKAAQTGQFDERLARLA